MEVVLINPGSNIIKSLSKFKRLVSYEFPSIGLAYIAAVLDKNKVKVTIIDQFVQNIDDSEVLRIIKEKSPDIVGFSCLTHNMGTVKKIVKELKNFSSPPMIILGNTHAAVFSEDLLRQGLADIVIRGEGEYSMLEIVQAVEQGKNLNGIKGISFIKDNVIYRNFDREPILDLDELPYPAWHLFNLNFYPLLLLNGPALPIRTSRGCPYDCYFCVQDKTFKAPRLRAVKNVIDELDYMRNKFNISNFVLLDAYFPFTIKYGFDFCDEIKRRKLDKKIKWGIETRVDKVNFELLKEMKEAGLRLVLYGFEVGNQKVLDSLQKKTTAETAKKVAGQTKKIGIIFQGLFILGLPGETKETCEQTIRFSRELNCDIVKFNLAMPFPGSQFYEDYKDKIPDMLSNPEQFDSWHIWSSYAGNPVYTPEGMTGKELISLQKKAMRQFYIRPAWIIEQILSRKIPFKYMFYGLYILIRDYFNNSFLRIN